MTPETAAAVARLEASGIVAEAIAAVRVDYVYAAEIAQAHADMARQSERIRQAHAARVARAGAVRA